MFDTNDPIDRDMLMDSQLEPVMAMAIGCHSTGIHAEALTALADRASGRQWELRMRPEPSVTTEAILEDIADMRRRGMSIRAIADEIGLSFARTRELCREQRRD